MLPNITQPISLIEQPSTKRKLKFRPFLVKEEKILLMAKESDNFQDILVSIKSIVQNCCMEKDFDVNKIAIFDLEFIFLRLRAISINNVQQFMSIDPDDQKEYQHIINFDDIKVSFPPESVSNKIDAGSGLYILLKYPTCDLLDKPNLLDNFKKGGIFDLVVFCIEKVFHNDTLLNLEESEKSELIDNLTVPVYRKIEEYLINCPKIEYKIQWTNSLDTQKAWVFKSIKDFFLFL